MIRKTPGFQPSGDRLPVPAMIRKVHFAAHHAVRVANPDAISARGVLPPPAAKNQVLVSQSSPCLPCFREIIGIRKALRSSEDLLDDLRNTLNEIRHGLDCAVVLFLVAAFISKIAEKLNMTPIGDLKNTNLLQCLVELGDRDILSHRQKPWLSLTDIR